MAPDPRHNPPLAPPPPDAPAPAKRQLRLSVILDQLRDDAIQLESGTATQAGSAEHAVFGEASPAGGGAAESVAAPGLTIGDVVDRARTAGFGFVIAFLTICSMPIPGASVPFGIMIVFGALQMLVGLQRPWLPRWLRQRHVSAAVLDKLARQMTRWTSWLEVAVRPRFMFMVRGLGWFVCALSILVLALGLSLPLPIPWSNVFFAAPILLYAIAMLESDGLLIMLGHAVVAAQINLIVRLWDVIWAALSGVLHWMGSEG